MNMKNFLMLSLILVANVLVAQKVEVVSGNFAALKGQSEVNVIFDYSNLKMMKENITEAQYVQNRVKDLNEKTKGNGEIWKKKVGRS